MLAAKLGYRYLDTGALYRAVALAIQDAGITSESRDDSFLETLLPGIRLEYQCTESLEARVILNGADVSRRLRSPEIALLASAVSAKPWIRAFLLEQQREMGKDGGMICEGRDMGTVVFPDADVKFYLDASAEIRARRRFDELPPDTRPELPDLVRQIAARDLADSTRAAAPLRKPENAFVIDSSDLDAAAVVDQMESHIRAAFDLP
jgi:cytidylate kinase